MARHISVYRAEDAVFLAQRPDVNSLEFDSWESEANRRIVYEMPLGSEDAIRRLWSEPAQHLALPLLAV